MWIELECMYCGYKWGAYVRNKEDVEGKTCLLCKDSTLKIRDRTTAKVDYYQGAPPFPPKPIDDGDFPTELYDSSEYPC